MVRMDDHSGETSKLRTGVACHAALIVIVVDSQMSHGNPITAWRPRRWLDARYVLRQ
jgi:hypothetical protein